jgi:hypothetical protein
MARDARRAWRPEASSARSPDVGLVATFALIHGGGGSAWDWHLVAPELRERGHDPVAVDLPSEDESAGWSEYADTVVHAVGERRDLVVVRHSLGGFTAPLVCAHVPVELFVLVAAMIPSPGELFADWWTNTGFESSGYDDVFYHDVPPRRGRGQAARTGRDFEGTAGALAPRGLAGHADEVSPLPRRPHVSGRMGASSCPRAPRSRSRRDEWRPLHLPQPTPRAGPATRGIRRRRSLTARKATGPAAG